MSVSGAIGPNSDVLLAGTAAINIWANENPTIKLNCQNVRAIGSDLTGALLVNADLSGATFQNCKLIGARFDGAVLTATRFISCDLRKCTIRSTNVSSTTITHSILDGISFANTYGVSQLSGLETCRITDRELDVDFDPNKCRLIDRFISWSKIRGIGQLRLFLPSYIALVTSIFFLTSMGLLNDRLRLARDTVTGLVDKGYLTSSFGSKLLEAAQPWHSSWRHLAVLASTLAIALGSTLYLFCPSRIKEFTLDQWRYVADRPSFEYQVDTWVFPGTRIWCAILYGIGGLIAAILLGDTLVRATLLIIRSLLP